jgi:hypothetical protein
LTVLKLGMTTRATVYEQLSAKLLDIETALLQSDPSSLTAACQALIGAMSEVQSCTVKSVNVPRLTERQAVELDSKFKLLRQAVLQKSASNDRLLETLLPNELMGGYGNKSAFGGSRRSTIPKSYQV